MCMYVYACVCVHMYESVYFVHFVCVYICVSACVYLVHFEDTGVPGLEIFFSCVNLKCFYCTLYTHERLYSHTL